MKNNINHSKLNWGMTLAVMAMLFPCLSFAQVRIDWQYCYGAEGSDYATSVLPTENGILVLGTVSHPQNPGMVSCELENDKDTPWLIRIDDQGEILEQQCWQRYNRNNSIRIKKAKTGDNEYYMNTHEYGEVTVRKIDDGLNEIWSREIGYFGTDMVPTDDGGVILGNSYGVLDKEYGEDSLLKLDSNGNVEWRISIGMEVKEIAQTKDGGFLVGGYIWGLGESHLLKLTPDGALEWSRTYDVTPCLIRELEDGLVLANSTYFAGEGAHGQTDIWLARTDEVGNILWSHYYGGSSFDAPSAVFPNTNGGFTVFGYTSSIDGDVQSNSDGSGSEFDLWIFQVDGSGQLLWERSIGTPLYNEYVYGVAKTGEYKYVIAANMFWEETPSGDVNCPNSTEIPNSGTNYWVLHVTDTINSAGVPESSSPIEVQVFPNPAKGTVYIQGMEPVEVLVYDAIGKLVRTIQNTNEIDVGDLPKGLYVLRITDVEGVSVTKHIIVSK